MAPCQPPPAGGAGGLPPGAALGRRQRHSKVADPGKRLLGGVRRLLGSFFPRAARARRAAGRQRGPTATSAAAAAPLWSDLSKDPWADAALGGAADVWNLDSAPSLAVATSAAPLERRSAVLEAAAPNLAEQRGSVGSSGWSDAASEIAAAATRVSQLNPAASVYTASGAGLAGTPPAAAQHRPAAQRQGTPPAAAAGGGSIWGLHSSALAAGWGGGDAGADPLAPILASSLPADANGPGWDSSQMGASPPFNDAPGFLSSLMHQVLLDEEDPPAATSAQPPPQHGSGERHAPWHQQQQQQRQGTPPAGAQHAGRPGAFGLGGGGLFSLGPAEAAVQLPGLHPHAAPTGPHQSAAFQAAALAANAAAARAPPPPPPASTPGGVLPSAGIALAARGGLFGEGTPMAPGPAHMQQHQHQQQQQALHRGGTPHDGGAHAFHHQQQQAARGGGGPSGRPSDLVHAFAQVRM